jgi:hypothetical protein
VWYGARPSKPTKTDASQLPGIAKQLTPNYPIDQASSEPNVFKTFFTAFSPDDYALYCKKRVKPNLTCTPWDAPKYPGMNTKTASDYLPLKWWPADQLPEGYTCAEPYLFPDLDESGGPQRQDLQKVMLVLILNNPHFVESMQTLSM